MKLTARTTARTVTHLVAIALAAGAGACVTDAATTAVDQELAGSPILLPWSGTGQDRAVMDTFEPLVVELHDTYGQPIAHTNVWFSAPATGASAWLALGGLVQTDTTGRASIIARANATAGTYVVYAEVDGADPIPFVLTNLAGPPALATPVAGTGQRYLVGLPFPAPLELAVTDSYGNAVAGTTVQFVAPTAGATTSMTSEGLVITDAGGHARVTATAGTIAGTYTVSAHVAGAPPVPFVLTNLGEMKLPGSVTAEQAAVATTGTLAP